MLVGIARADRRCRGHRSSRVERWARWRCSSPAPRSRASASAAASRAASGPWSRSPRRTSGPACCRCSTWCPTSGWACPRCSPVSRVVHGGGLIDTARYYGVAVIALAALALIGLLRRGPGRAARPVAIGAGAAYHRQVCLGRWLSPWQSGKRPRRGSRRGTGCWPRPTSSSTTRACTPSASTGSSSEPAWPRRRSTTPSAARTSWSAPTWRPATRSVTAADHAARGPLRHARASGCSRVFEAPGRAVRSARTTAAARSPGQRRVPPGDQAEQAAGDYRQWVRALLTDLAAAAGAPEPDVLARQLHLLYDGSSQSARMDHDPAVAAAARDCAAVLLDAALAGGSTTPRS